MQMQHYWLNPVFPHHSYVVMNWPCMRWHAFRHHMLLFMEASNILVPLQKARRMRIICRRLPHPTTLRSYSRKCNHDSCTSRPPADKQNYTCHTVPDGCRRNTLVDDLTDEKRPYENSPPQKRHEKSWCECMEVTKRGGETHAFVTCWVELNESLQISNRKKGKWVTRTSLWWGQKSNKTVCGASRFRNRPVRAC